MPLKTKLKRINIALATLALALGIGVGSGTGTVFAEGPNCINHVFHYASWGAGRACVSALYYVSGTPMRNHRVTVDDTLTDGYCVHAEGRWAVGGWFGIQDSNGLIQSCGPSYTSNQIGLSNDLVEIRMVRGPIASPPNGIGVNYLTLWPD